MTISDHKQLLIWQRGMALTEKVYALTNSFPKNEMFQITSQMRRASYSVPSNIAEGWNKGGIKSRLHFLDIAKGSLAELETFSILSGRLKYLDDKTVKELTTEANEIIKMINGMKKHLQNQNSALKP